MTKRISTALSLSLSLAMLSALPLPAHAGDTKLLLPIEGGLKAPTADTKLDGSVKFYFAGQAHPEVQQQITTEFFNRKTNAFAKNNTAVCNWAFLSGLIALQDHAKEVGANAVVNIVSYYNDQEMASDTQFECHVGFLMAGIALKGDFVRIEDKAGAKQEDKQGSK